MPAIESLSAAQKAAVRSGIGVNLRGALLRLNAPLTAQNFTAGGTIPWEAAEYDTEGAWSLGVNPNRLTVPASTDITYAKVSTSISLTNHTSDLWTILTIRKGGTHDWTYGGATTMEVGLTGPRMYCATPWVPVTAGEYFDLRIDAETDTSIDVGNNRSWFAIEFR